MQTNLPQQDDLKNIFIVDPKDNKTKSVGEMLKHMNLYSYIPLQPCEYVTKNGKVKAYVIPIPVTTTHPWKSMLFNGIDTIKRTVKANKAIMTGVALGMVSGIISRVVF